MKLIENNMETLDIKTQEQIKELIDWVFKPTNITLSRFGDSYIIHHTSRHGNDPERKWDEKMYFIYLRKDSQEFIDSISELHMNKSIADAVWVMAHDLCYQKNITDEEKNELLKRLYSQDFLDILNCQRNS